jgi:hypothetical protein
MPCLPVATHNGVAGKGRQGGGGFKTFQQCLKACHEGACCESGVCAVKAQCQCTGTYQGPGSTCSPNPCNPLP